MVKVDFTSYTTLASCPTWWRGFVNSITEGVDVSEERLRIIEEELAKNGCMSIDDPYEEGDLICLVFESEEARRAFITYWTLKGNPNAC